MNQAAKISRRRYGLSANFRKLVFQIQVEKILGEQIQIFGGRTIGLDDKAQQQAVGPFSEADLAFIEGLRQPVR